MVEAAAGTAKRGDYMNLLKRIGRRFKLGAGLLVIGFLTGCDGGYYSGGGYPDADSYYGPDYNDYLGPEYYGYGGMWGPDAYVFGHHHHGGFDHAFANRGFQSRGA
jgi:hypothetical protein